MLEFLCTLKSPHSYKCHTFTEPLCSLSHFLLDKEAKIPIYSLHCVKHIDKFHERSFQQIFFIILQTILGMKIMRFLSGVFFLIILIFLCLISIMSLFIFFFYIFIRYSIQLHLKCYPLIWFSPLKSLPPSTPLLTNPSTPASWPCHSATLRHRAFIV